MIEKYLQPLSVRGLDVSNAIEVDAHRTIDFFMENIYAQKRENAGALLLPGATTLTLYTEEHYSQITALDQLIYKPDDVKIFIGPHLNFSPFQCISTRKGLKIDYDEDHQYYRLIIQGRNIQHIIEKDRGMDNYFIPPTAAKA